ncbi:winged helix-turn-helix domain-containing protein [Lentzea alba]|uniref:AfsR/SARP family transcriptional regulator n=1 Tax=Lentzea alba TaxID=2714351 RepID=UPI0039BFAD6F
MTVEYRILGPLEVLLDGRPVALPAGRGRVLLATLLLRPNRFVSVHELVERVWDGAPPDLDRAHKTLHMTVTRLRQALGAANCVRTETGGYLADVLPEQLDLTRFRALTAAGDHHAALRLWRGPVLVDVVSETLHRDDVPLLVEERLVALEKRIDADLAGGKARELVPELQELTRDHPLRDTFWRQLMLALYRSGQQAGALQAYRQVSDMLADELGIDPAPALADLHEQILRGTVASLDQRPSGPRQLPPALATFAGRDAELRQLDSSTSRLLVITGSGGVGKTSLAVNWGHRTASRFPDGQVFVNLRGQDPAQKMSPQVALALVLKGLGVAAAPVDLDEQVALYRSLVADRTILLVLDNVAGPEQVRPLLPASSTSLTLVTSRNELQGLALHDAEFLRLSTLDDDAGVRLLEQVLGERRVRAEVAKAHALVRLCAGLPLALRIAAAELSVNQDRTIAQRVAQLQDDRLGGLAVPGDPAAAVGVVFDESYSSLPAEARTVFRRLGLLPGADFTADDAAVIAGLPKADGVLNLLVGTHLVERRPDDRFALHDLLRVYARERCEKDEADAAIQRLYDFYRRMIDDAGELCFPDRYRFPLETTSTQLPHVVLRTAEDAFAWLRTEHVNLLATVQMAADRGDHWPASQIGAVLNDYHYYEVRNATQWAALIGILERVADECGDDLVVAMARQDAYVYHFVQGDYVKARQRAQEAAELGGLDIRAGAFNALAIFAQIAGDLGEAVDLYEAALAAFTEAGSPEGRGRVLMNLVGARFQQGNLIEAERDQQEVFAVVTSPTVLNSARQNAAVISLELGKLADVVTHVDLYRQTQQKMGTGSNDPMIINILARAEVALGRLDEAFDLVLGMFEEMRSKIGVEEEAACWIALAEVLDARGEHADALDAGLVLVRLSEGDGMVTDRAQGHLHVARAARHLGDHDTAAQHLAEMRDLAEAYPIGIGEEQRERALLHLALGEVDDALRCAEEAVATHRRFHQRYHEAKSLAVLAEVRKAAGDAEGARAAEALAAAAFTECGAPLGQR